MRRVAIQEKLDRARAEAERRRFEEHGYSTSAVPTLDAVPLGHEKVLQARGEGGYELLNHIEDHIIDTPEYSGQEREFVELACSAARLFGLEQVFLLDGDVPFAGAFMLYRGTQTMFLGRTLGHSMGQMSSGTRSVDEATDTIAHELAHLLERIVGNDTSQGELLEQGYIAHVRPFTHQRVGMFAEAMKYVAVVWLAAMVMEKVGCDSDRSVCGPGGTAGMPSPSSLLSPSI